MHKGAQVGSTTFKFIRQSAAFLVSGAPAFWNDGSGRGAIAKRDVDDIGYIKAMIDYVKAKFNVDSKRIFVTGFSSGASMTWRVGVELSDEVAAIAPVSGHLWIENPQLKRPVPLLFIIGTDDPLNPLAGGEVTLPWLSIKQYHPPIQNAIDAWAKANGCPATGKVDSDTNGVKRTIYSPCDSDASITYYTIADAGHVWPGGVSFLPERIVGKRTNKMKATDVIWDWFAQHPMTN